MFAACRPRHRRRRFCPLRPSPETVAHREDCRHSGGVARHTRPVALAALAHNWARPPTLSRPHHRASGRTPALSTGYGGGDAPRRLGRHAKPMRRRLVFFSIARRRRRSPDHPAAMLTPTSAAQGFQWLKANGSRVGTTLASPAGHAKSFWQAETEALEQEPLGAIGAHDAAQSQFAAGRRRRRQDDVGAGDAGSSWRSVRGLLPRPARFCHCSSVFHST